MKKIFLLIFVFALVFTWMELPQQVIGHTKINHTDVKYEPVSFDLLKRFHGHAGPFVVLGSHMGEHAVTQQEMPRFFGVTVIVECPEEPPHSCLIDGLMVSTGATMGKRNITLVPADRIRVTIRNEKTGKEVIYTLKDSMLGQLSIWEKKDVDVELRGELTFQMKPMDLFEIEVNIP